MTRRFTIAINHVLGVLPRHPGAGREHQRPDDGLDDGRLLGPPGLLAGHRHRASRSTSAARRAARRPPAAGWSYVLEAHAESTGPRPRRACGSPSRASATSARGPRASCTAAGARSSPCPTSRRRASTTDGLDVAVARRGRGGQGRGRATPRRPVSTASPTRSSSTGPCDVLIPAALGEVIDGDNADATSQAVGRRSRPPTTPMTPDGDKVLGDRGVTVVPDILANAGGVTGLVLRVDARTSSSSRGRRSGSTPSSATGMTARLRRHRRPAAELGCTLRQAAFAIGIERVAQAARLRGYV